LFFTPLYVACRIVANLAEPTGIEETEKRSLGGNIVESRRSSTGLKPFADNGARIASKCGHDGGLSRAGLSQEPNHRCGSLRAFAGSVSLSRRWLAIGKPNVSKQVQEPMLSQIAVKPHCRSVSAPPEANLPGPRLFPPTSERLQVKKLGTSMAFYVGRRARFSFRRGALLPPADGARQIRRYFESRGISSVGSGRPEPDRVGLSLREQV
jgi:hypothetical protein